MVQNEVVPIQPQAVRSEVNNKIVVSVAGEDEFIDYEQFGLSFDSAERDVLTAIRPFIREKYNTDLMSEGGDWLYKTRKATTSRNIHVIPNSTAGVRRAQPQAPEAAPQVVAPRVAEGTLSVLDNRERLRIYETITNGCMHLWSKNKLQEDRLTPVLRDFATLAERDPLFLAHFVSYAFKKMDSKDLKVVALFANSLSDADGTPFFAGAELKKPNWRSVSQAAFIMLDPKLALRVLKLANSKRAFGRLTNGTHFSKTLKTAARKYLKYREVNPKMLQGIRKAGLSKTVISMYRIARLAPSPEAVRILRWKQKPGFPGSGVKIEKSETFNFKGLSDLEVAQKIRAEKLKPQAVLGALPDKLSPVIAAAILEQCTGDQAVVLTSMFEEQGLLKNKEVKEVYTAKLKTAKQALDRVERIRTELDEQTKAVMKDLKADVRKEQVGDIGKVFMHIDVSGSMTDAINIAKEKGAIVAECVKNPAENFHWGIFSGVGHNLPRPQRFTKDGFHAALYGIRPGGSTNCFAMFEVARQLGCDTDVYVTDGQHTDGDARTQIRRFKEKYPGQMPKNVVIIKCGGYVTTLENAFLSEGISVSTIGERALTESALVAQAIKAAVLGATAVVDEIMATPLLQVPTEYAIL